MIPFRAGCSKPVQEVMVSVFDLEGSLEFKCLILSTEPKRLFVSSHQPYGACVSNSFFCGTAT